MGRLGVVCVCGGGGGGIIGQWQNFTHVCHMKRHVEVEAGEYL